MTEKCFLYDTCNHIDCNSDFCIRKYKLNYLYEESNLSYKQRFRQTLRIDADGTDLEQFKTLSNIEKDITNFVMNGRNVFIHSKICGNGKTSWAIRLAQAYLESIWHTSSLTCKVLFISVPRFLQALKDNISNKNDYAEHIKQNIMKADLVIFDEISAKVGTEFELNSLLSYIDGRLASGKTCIYTANKNIHEVADMLGERLASRISAALDIELFGSDKRTTLERGDINA